VSDPLIDEDDASTPLSVEERDALIPSYVTQRRELNEVEQIGVADADRWAFSRKRDVLNEEFLLQLHKRMFGGVWKWAGTIRTTEKNIGDVPVWRVQQDLRQLLDDARAQIEFEAYPADEIALRLHNRLTWIHPVPNGNGRLARLVADLLVVQLGKPRFTWGSGSLVPDGELRRRYITAQRAADGQVIEPLVEFARS
jgi:Fic-DOC domain mobile mystery protein B